MFSLCRLCAKSIAHVEISSNISELEQKLKKVLCCGWKSQNEWRLPQKVCEMCVDELQRSWSFAEKVQTAEQQLNKLTSEAVSIEVEPTSHSEEVSVGEVKEELYIEPIELEPFEHNFDCGGFDDPINASDGESSYSTKSKLVNEIKHKKRTKPTKTTKKTITKAKSTPKSVQARQPEENHIGCDSAKKKSVTKRLKKYKEQTKKTAEKTDSKVDNFLTALLDEDRLPGGRISTNGVTKLEKLFPDMKTTAWADIQYKCNICNQTYKGPQNFFAHNRSLHLEQTKTMVFSCVYCNSKHRLEFSLNKHLAKKHFPHLKFRCYYCTDYYWDDAELIDHRNMHKNIEYRCEHCGKILYTRDTLYMHVAQRHLNKRYGDPETTFICDLCGKVCATKTSIQNHLLLHTQTYDYVCDQCGWKFRSKGGLKTHLDTTHGNERPFSCEQCDQRFKTKAQMKKHAKIHEDYKAFECTECHKRFRTNSCLTVHKRSHSKICPYTCKYCDKKFSYTSSLRTHERTHTDEKPYICNYCHYKSTNWPNLNKHSLQVHSIDLRVKKDSKTQIDAAAIAVQMAIQMN